MVELPVDAFGVQRFVGTAPREDHISHLVGFTPSVWQSTLRERAVKAAEGGCNLSC